jgi:hypothetical protein
MKSTLDERRDPALGRMTEKRAFKISLAIFLSVNALLLVLWAALAVAGLRATGQLWPYPLVMGIWGVVLAVQGYTAYRGKPYTEDQIQREIKHLPG